MTQTVGSQRKLRLPYGDLDLSQAKVITRKDGTDIIVPYPKHPNPDIRGLHHHMYWDSRRDNTIGLALTRTDGTQVWREYFIDRGHGWEFVGSSHPAKSVHEFNQRSQKNAQERAFQRKVGAVNAERSAAPVSPHSPNPAVTPEQPSNPSTQASPNVKQSSNVSPALSKPHPDIPQPPVAPSPSVTPTR